MTRRETYADLRGAGRVTGAARRSRGAGPDRPAGLRHRRPGGRADPDRRRRHHRARLRATAWRWGRCWCATREGAPGDRPRAHHHRPRARARRPVGLDRGRGDGRPRARPSATCAARSRRGAVGGDGQQAAAVAARPRAAPGGRRRPARSCASRPRRAPRSRSSRCCASRCWPPRSRPSPASSTAPPTSSSPRWRAAGCPTATRWRAPRSWATRRPTPPRTSDGADAAAKMAILSSHRLPLAGADRRRALRGHRPRCRPRTSGTRASLGFVVKLVGVARLVNGSVSVRVYPALVPRGHRLAAIGGPDNAVLLESRATREIMLVGPGAGGDETASAVVADILSILGTHQGSFLHNALADAGRTDRPARLGGVGLLHAHVGGRPAGRAGARGARSSADAGALDPLGACRADRATRRSLVLVLHAGPEDARAAGGGARRARSTTCCGEPVMLRVLGSGAGGDGERDARSIERYRDFLPVGPYDPGRVAGRGRPPRSCRCRGCPSASACAVHAKLEGMNPTASFKDRGMTMAVSKAVEEGAERRHLRLDRQHLGVGGRLRRPRRPDGRGRDPRGQDRRRQARPGAGPRRARAGAGRRLRRRADGGARAGRAPPDRPGQLAQRVPHRRPAHGGLRGVRRARRRPRRPLHPGGQRRQHQRLLARVPGLPRGRALARAAAPLRLPGRRGGAAGGRRPGRAARDRRHRHPHRQARPRRAGAGRDARVGRRRGRGHRLADPRGLPNAGGRGGHLLRAGLGGLGRRADAARRGGRPGPRARRSSACSPATA